MDTEIQDLKNEIAVVTELIRQCIIKNANSTIDQAEYQKIYNGLASSYVKTKNKFEKMEELCKERIAKRDQMNVYISILKQQDRILTEFDETLWCAAVEKVTVNGVDDIRIIFKGGAAVKSYY